MNSDWPTTKKGMDALVKGRLIACIDAHQDNILRLCDYGIYERVGFRLVGVLAAHHQRAKKVYSLDNAKSILASGEICSHPKSAETIASMHSRSIMSCAETAVMLAFDSAALRLGYRMRKVFSQINFPTTGDVTRIPNGSTLDHHLGLTNFSITTLDIASMINESSDKRVFRRRVDGAGQLTWLTDKGIAVFKALGFNFIADATFY